MFWLWIDVGNSIKNFALFTAMNILLLVLFTKPIAILMWLNYVAKVFRNYFTSYVCRGTTN